MSKLHHFTRSGLPGIDSVPFGMHSCHFYSDRDQLLAALVPYFVAGLRGNERCRWVTAPPLPAREAIQALRAASDGIDDAIEMDALRVLDFDEWYATSGKFKGLDLVQVWLEEEEQALADGYNALRISGNASFLKPSELSTFMQYERHVTARFAGRRIVALCSYAVAQCNDRQMREVMNAHLCGFERTDANWQVVPINHKPRQRAGTRSYEMGGRVGEHGG